MKTLKRIVFWTLAIIVGYFAIGIFLSEVVFPIEKVDYSTYFLPGDRFISYSEGFHQTILATNDGWVHLRLDAEPSAPGPPLHIHENFEETFYVNTGVLSILVNGEKKVLNAGESFTVPRMTAHKPFNETTGTVVVVSDQDTKTMPAQFAYFLSQIYPLVDKFNGKPSPISVIMQFAVWGSDTDSYLAEGPPVAVQKVMRVLLRPTARLLGYKYYYPEYKPQH